MWMVRAGANGVCFSEFEAKEIVAIGFSLEAKCGEMSYLELQHFMRSKFGDDVPGRIVQYAATAYRFLQQISVGDKVATYDPRGREYLIGQICSDPTFAPDRIEGMTFLRSVAWKSRCSRDILSAATRAALGPTTAVFRIADEAAFELEAEQPIPDQPAPPQSSEPATESDLIETVQSESIELIKDRIAKMPWDDVQRLVAGVLRAMGYRTRVSPAGPDRGKDIVASPDGLGFRNPRIAVEVKHRKGKMGAPELRSFIGACSHPEDRGLFVSTGGFTKEAYYEAERAKTPVTLMDIDDLVDALVENYDRMDIEARSILPLTRIYWPSAVG